MLVIAHQGKSDAAKFSMFSFLWSIFDGKNERSHISKIWGKCGVEKVYCTVLGNFIWNSLSFVALAKLVI